MFEIKVTWSDETTPPSTYQFKSLGEAEAFEKGLAEACHVSDSPQVYNIEKGRWGDSGVAIKQSPWLAVLFSLFVGAWTGLWWNLLNWDMPVAISEHILMGAVTTLGCYLCLLVYGRIKK